MGKNKKKNKGKVESPAADGEKEEEVKTSDQEATE